MPDSVPSWDLGIAFYLPIDSLIPHGPGPVGNAAEVPLNPHPSAARSPICGATKPAMPAAAILAKVLTFSVGYVRPANSRSTFFPLKGVHGQQAPSGRPTSRRL